MTAPQDDVPTLVATSALYRTRREYHKALRCASQALQRDSHYPNVYFEIALLYFDCMLPKEVHKICRLALILLPPNKYWEHIFLGFLQENIQEWEKAKARYKMALKANDTTDDFYIATFNIACMYTHSAKYDKAKRRFHKALEIQKNTISSPHQIGLCLNNIGMCYGFESDTQSAHKFYTEAVTTCPQLLRSFQQRIETNLALGNRKEALNDCNTAIKLTTHRETIAEIYMSRIFANNQTIQGIVNDTQEAIRYNPRSATSYDLLTRMIEPGPHFDPIRLLLDAVSKCHGDAQGMSMLYTRLAEIEEDQKKVMEYDNIAEALYRRVLDRVS
jgi:tetratricopeptide (TPR) repeat protein